MKGSVMKFLSGLASKFNGGGGNNNGGNTYNINIGPTYNKTVYRR